MPPASRVTVRFPRRGPSTTRRSTSRLDLGARRADEASLPPVTAQPSPPKRKASPKVESHLPQVQAELEKHDKMMVAMTAPAVRVAIAEELGLEPGTIATPQLVTALRKAGFDYVFDVNTAADLTILEEGTEFIQRLATMARGEAGHRLPLMTSCCPGWINVVECCYPELVPHLSTCKSPSTMQGALIKARWAPEHGLEPDGVSLVSIMPCVRKQGEADRPWFNSTGRARDIDHVINTREAGQLLRSIGLDGQSFLQLAPGEFDHPLAQSSGGAALFGTSGGVMEAALRVVYELCTGEAMPSLEFEPVRGLEGIKEATVTLVPRESGPLGQEAAGKTVQLKIAVVNGLKNVKELTEDMKAGRRCYHMVECMACPGGCIGGGGQPISKDRQALAKRQAALYAIDRDSGLQGAVRASHQNAAVMEGVYGGWLQGAPGSEAAHRYLHTHYVPGGVEALADPGVARSAAACAAHKAMDMQLTPPALGPDFPPPPPPLGASGPPQQHHGEGGEACAALWGVCEQAEAELGGTCTVQWE